MHEEFRASTLLNPRHGDPATARDVQGAVAVRSPCPELPGDLAAENAALREQIGKLVEALDHRADIDQAIGMIMLAHCCDAAAATRLLKRLSQDTNVKVRDIAEVMAHIVADTDPAQLDWRLYEIGLRALLDSHDAHGGSPVTPTRE